MLNIKNIQPMFNHILVTADVYDEDIYEGGIIVSSKGTLKEYQKVVAIGSIVKDINIGDLVKINPMRYAVKKHKEGSLKDGVVTDNPVVQFNFNMVKINDVNHILLADNDIEYIVKDYTITKDTPSKKSKLIVPKHKLIVQ